MTTDHMYAASTPGPQWPSESFSIFTGEPEVTGYNNHAYIAYHDGRFIAMWSCDRRDGNQLGQHVRFATSADARTWSDARFVIAPDETSQYIARGLWQRDGELLALAAFCTGHDTSTQLEALQAYRWEASSETWHFAGILGEHIINNFPPMRLPDGRWLMPYRYKGLNRVDGVLVGGTESIDNWSRVEFPGEAKYHMTEANAILRADGSLAVHLRDNTGGGFLYRTISVDQAQTFTAPAPTDFPDCKCKHICLRLSTGRYVLINNPHSRKELWIATSDDGNVFTRHAPLHTDPPAVRAKGRDKSPGYTYPHAIEHDHTLYIIHSVNRDDIAVTHIPVSVF